MIWYQLILQWNNIEQVLVLYLMIIRILIFSDYVKKQNERIIIKLFIIIICDFYECSNSFVFRRDIVTDKNFVMNFFHQNSTMFAKKGILILVILVLIFGEYNSNISLVSISHLVNKIWKLNKSKPLILCYKNIFSSSECRKRQKWQRKKIYLLWCQHGRGIQSQTRCIYACGCFCKESQFKK